MAEARLSTVISPKGPLIPPPLPPRMAGVFEARGTANAFVAPGGADRTPINVAVVGGPSHSVVTSSQEAAQLGQLATAVFRSSGRKDERVILAGEVPAYAQT
ncbi:unnamed protein product, partial [Phaeothamnion confervicola]